MDLPVPCAYGLAFIGPWALFPVPRARIIKLTSSLSNLKQNNTQSGSS